MTCRLVGTFDLKDRHTGHFVEAQLLSPADETNVGHVEQLWRPEFLRRVTELAKANSLTLDALGENNIQDAHWDWAKKIDLSVGRLDRVSFAVEAEGTTQGLMLVKTVGFAREQSQLNLPMIEIEFLATAPWNRNKFTPNPRFKGVGRLLLTAAISLSVHEEFKGRIGLHALPEAEDWYRNVCGMTDLGIDETQMRYFEMTETQARTYLA